MKCLEGTCVWVRWYKENDDGIKCSSCGENISFNDYEEIFANEMKEYLEQVENELDKYKEVLKSTVKAFVQEGSDTIYIGEQVIKNLYSIVDSFEGFNEFEGKQWKEDNNE